MTHAATLATAWRYPVKSMRGEELNAAAIGPAGLIGDRAYALVDRETGAVVRAKNPKKWPDIFACRASYLDSVGNGALPAIHITPPDGNSLRSDAPDSEERISKAPVTLSRRCFPHTPFPLMPSLRQHDSAVLVVDRIGRL